MRNRTQRLIVGVLTAALTAVLAFSSSLPQSEVYAADGQVYRGTGEGHEGSIVVDVTVQDRKIMEIDVVSQNETPEYWERARDFINRIIRYQRWDESVDAISGATDSSNGIREAVAYALRNVEIDRTGVPEPGEDDPVIVIKETDSQPEIVTDPVTDPSHIFESGTGTEEDPYIISTADQMRRFALSVKDDRYDRWEDGTPNTYKDRYVALAGDIDLSDGIWIPVGQGVSSFDGTFDGRGHSITGIYAGTAEKPMRLLDNVYYYGFFGSLEMHANIRNLTLEGVDLHISGARNITLGGLAGITQREYSESEKDGAVIDNCRVTGSVELIADTHNNMAGGLVGQQVRGAIVNSSSDTYVSCIVTDKTMYAQAGGLVGGQALALVANCTATGDVYASIPSGDGGFAHAGSLVAIMDGDIVNCYGTGKVTSEYSTGRIGALFGTIDEAGKAYNCCYDPETEVICAGTGKEPAPAGFIYDKNDEEAVSEDGRRYIGGIAYMLSEGRAGTETADRLNSNYGSFPVDLSIYGMDSNCLRRWVYEGGSMMPSGGPENVNYELCEADVVDLDLLDGTYYGRSADGSTVVKITVDDGKVAEKKTLAGEASGSTYYDALDTAREKSAQGDISGYGKASAGIFGGGNGTQSDPYRIRNAKQLHAIAAALNEDEDFAGVYFRQTADIDVSGQNWLPIGWGVKNINKTSDEDFANYPFAGHFDGNGYRITGLTIGTADGPVSGGCYGGGAALFGIVSGSQIRNVILENTYINVAADNRQSVTAGGIAAHTGSGTRIENCKVSGTIIASSAKGDAGAGGIAGYASNTGTKGCIADVDISVTGDTANAGGLFGRDADCVTVDCLSQGDVSGSEKARIGGLSGTAAGLMYNCVAYGKAEGGFAGVLHGIRMGNSAVDCKCYYDSARGDKVAALDYASSEAQKGHTGVSSAELAGEDFVSTLNENSAAADTAIAEIKANTELNVKYIDSNYASGGSPAGWVLSDGGLSIDQTVERPSEPAQSGDQDKADDGKTPGAAAQTADTAAAGSASAVIRDLPKLKLKKAARSGRRIAVKWKKPGKKALKKIGKIQIQYSTSRYFEDGKTKTVTAGKKKTSKKIKGLKKGKTYYVRIRAYRKLGDTEHVSSWSRVRKVRIR